MFEDGNWGNSARGGTRDRRFLIVVRYTLYSLHLRLSAPRTAKAAPVLYMQMYKISFLTTRK